MSPTILVIYQLVYKLNTLSKHNISLLFDNVILFNCSNRYKAIYPFAPLYRVEAKT